MIEEAKKPIEYICLRKNKKATINCETCCGITNLCGMYENKYGMNFEEVFYELNPNNRWTN